MDSWRWVSKDTEREGSCEGCGRCLAVQFRGARWVLLRGAQFRIWFTRPTPQWCAWRLLVFRDRKFRAVTTQTNKPSFPTSALSAPAKQVVHRIERMSTHAKESQEAKKKKHEEL